MSIHSTQLARLARNGATEQAEAVSRRAASSRLAGDVARRSRPKFGWANFGIGIGIGIAGAVANFFIENDANTKEDEFFGTVLREFKSLGVMNQDIQRGINIVADKS